MNHPRWNEIAKANASKRFEQELAAWEQELAIEAEVRKFSRQLNVLTDHAPMEFWRRIYQEGAA